MKVIIQRVSQAKVTVDEKITGEIQKGILALVGIASNDTFDTIQWIANKLVNLRIFPDELGKMNLSVLDTKGGILIVSNFTVLGNAKKGFRPSFTEAAPPDFSKSYYEKFVNFMHQQYGNQITIGEGIFGAMMNIELINDGPVTLVIEK